jgi:hypothetical protein
MRAFFDGLCFKHLVISFIRDPGYAVIEAYTPNTETDEISGYFRERSDQMSLETPDRRVLISGKQKVPFERAKEKTSQCPIGFCTGTSVEMPHWVVV